MLDPVAMLHRLEHELHHQERLVLQHLQRLACLVAFPNGQFVHSRPNHSRGLEGFQILVRAGILLSLYDSFG